MNATSQGAPVTRKVGRPRRGTEAARTAALINAATRVFLREGYGLASIDKVAAEAGISTRTIYERFKNKADLLGAVINRLLDRVATVLATADLERLDPRTALMVIARTVSERALDPDSMALFRIAATESHRFPELAARMRENNKRCVDNVVANYLRVQVKRGELVLADPDKSASLFMHMLFAELHDCMLFGAEHAITALDMELHAAHVIEIFLNGAIPRPLPATIPS